MYVSLFVLGLLVCLFVVVVVFVLFCFVVFFWVGGGGCFLMTFRNAYL